MKKTTKNQVNNPKPQQETRKIYFKRNGASIAILEGLTPYDAAQRVDALTRLYSDWRGKFIISR